jgi:VWFA-related protein
MAFWPLLYLLAFQDFRAEVSLVHVDVEVRHDHRLIEGLTSTDFRVTDNGKAQDILYVGRQEQPLDIILLFDMSPSMRPVIQRVAETSRAALSQLRPGDRVAVMVFDNGMVGGFTGDFEAVERTIRSRVLSMRSGSRIQKAVDEAARVFLREKKTDRRRAVLAITDDLGMGREGKALRNLWEADAVLSGLIVRAEGSVAAWRLMAPQSLMVDFGMSSIAEKTGGDTLKAEDAGDGFRQIIERLRSRYTLHYAMPQGRAGDEHKIKVELAGAAAARFREAKIRARSGYVIPPYASTQTAR